MASISPNSVAALLLSNVPESQRLQIVRQAAQSLNESSDTSELNLVANLTQQIKDDEAIARLVDHLQSSIVKGDTQSPVALCKNFPTIGHTLLDAAVYHVCHVADQVRHGGPKILAVSVKGVEGFVPTSRQSDETVENLVSQSEKAAAHLHFIANVSSHSLEEHTGDRLFVACCTLVRSMDRTISLRARDCIIELYRLHPQVCYSHSQLLWSCVEALISCKLGFYQQLGHALLLRWVLSEVPVSKDLLQNAAYWNLLADGLRFGDSERRKSTLQVLRASVDLVADDDSLVELISSQAPCKHNSQVMMADGLLDASAIRQHYGRFCTIFETIVLGRYLNQVQECEADLDFLSSSQSAVKPVWLFTLLASALDPKLQDSNRKFVGAWVMHSHFRTDDWPSYIAFFQNSFLPWAMQGHLFTTSLRVINGDLLCTHGIELAQYTARLIASVDNSEYISPVIETIIDIMTSRQNKNFAYAKLYMLDGLSQALQDAPSLMLNSDQTQKINLMSAWSGLPEVARDYVHLKCRKLIDELHKRDDSLSSIIPNTWVCIRERVRNLLPSATAQSVGSVASWTSDLSNRDKEEQKIIQKCTDFSSFLQDRPEPSLDPESVEEKLSEIWSDLEYLEYPKDLLMVMPTIVLHRSVLIATTKGTEQSVELKEVIMRMTDDLVEFSRGRAYLLSPIVESVRRITIELPIDQQTLNLEDYVVALTEQPPVPTIDARLEDSTASLIKSIDSGFERLNYEYYFGARESYGMAMLLDTINRLGVSNKDIVKRILQRLLERWLTQKIPPPSVSQWKSVLQLQAMLICAEIITPTLQADEARKQLQDLHYILSIEPLPRYRYLLEWMITRVYIHHPSLRNIVFEGLRTKDHHTNPKFLASLMKIGVRIAKSSTSSEAYASQLADVFVPLAASSKVVIRHEAQWQIPLLLSHARIHSWTSINTNAAMQELDAFIRSLDRFDDPPLERRVDVFDPIHDHTMTHLVEGPWFALDTIESPLCSHADLIKIPSPPSLPAPCIPLGAPIHSSPSSPPPIPPSSPSRRILLNIDNISRALGSGPSPTALQTKGNAYLEAQPARHSTLLVVASLVDNPYNLGGLSRASEIFGAGALYVQSVAVTATRDFMNVSVSSHLHLPIHALAVGDLQGWLARKRREEGFAVVGIEQTDRSVLLGAEGCVLPEKCVLVLGSEKEGIPALVLGECDVLVEIPQVGITRSLNVQTAAAIVLCEYARQRRR